MHRSTEQLLTKLNVTHDFLEITRLSLLPKIVPRRLTRGREGLLLSIRPHRRTVPSSVFPSADRNCPHIDNNPSKFDLNQNAAHCKLNNSFWCRACCCHKVFPPKKHIYTFTFLTFPKLPYSALCESESFMFLSVFQTPSLTLLNLLLSSLIKRNGGRHLSVDTLQTNLKKKGDEVFWCFSSQRTQSLKIAASLQSFSQLLLLNEQILRQHVICQGVSIASLSRRN